MNDSADQPARARPTTGRKGIPSKRLLAHADERTFRVQIARRIQNLRSALGITQSELAAHLGASQGRIAHYETGRGAPRFHDVPVICRALGCDPNSLFEFTKE